MVSFFEMMQAKTAAYSTVGASETATSSTKNSQGTGNAGGAKGKKKSKADRLVDSSKPSKTYILYASIEQCPVKVFRRIKVPSNLWLGNLGKIFIPAFGWAGYHLSQFTKGDVYYTSRDNIDERDSFNFGCRNRHIDEMTVTVADVLPQKGSTISFEYDFGDGWIHNVRVSSVSDEPLLGEDICVHQAKEPAHRKMSGVCGAMRKCLTSCPGRLMTRRRRPHTRNGSDFRKERPMILRNLIWRSQTRMSKTLSP